MKRGVCNRFGLAVVGLLAVACATHPTTRAALESDLANLKREIAEAQRAGELNRSKVEDLAEAVARREVSSAKGPESADRLSGLTPCAALLESELAERAELDDEGAAVATLVLLDAGRLSSVDLVAKYAASLEPRWRAVAARAAVGAELGTWRRKLMVDGDARARRAAFRAAQAQPERVDLDLALEAARLDPDPVARSTAAHVVGAIGGEKAVLGLKDLWPTAEEGDRIALVEAWATRAAFESGGERQLLWVAETQSGIPALRAALALSAGDETSRDMGRGIVVRALGQGSRDEQRLALRLADLSDPMLLDAVVKLHDDSDDFVRVLALARLLYVAQHRQAAREALRKLADSKAQNTEGTTPSSVSAQARGALTAIQDESVAPKLVAELAAKSAARRRVAALGLLRLGRYSDAATALGDDSPDVRLTVACTILGQDH